MSSHSAQARALFDAALRDRLTLRLLRESGQAPEEVMGFHAQQACEKLIKAVLVMHGVVFERTHDLAALAAIL
jgi:HEPN domain-containing protein